MQNHTTKTANIKTWIVVVVHIAYKCQRALELKIPVLILVINMCINCVSYIIICCFFYILGIIRQYYTVATDGTFLDGSWKSDV